MERRLKQCLSAIYAIIQNFNFVLSEGEKMEIALKKWFDENVVFVGNQFTNKSDRRKYIPEIIVNHISEGDAISCIKWFTTPNNKDSSTHFMVAKDGKAYQFVAIEDNAWANGLANEQIKHTTSRIVKGHKANPNWYSVSIEHEGIYGDTQGKLTYAQYETTLMLHRYIKAYVKDTYDYDMIMDREHILGHYEINPVEKHFCPGELFPFDKLIEDLRKSDKMDIDEAIQILFENGIINEKEYRKKVCDVVTFEKEFVINVATYIQKLKINDIIT